MTQPHSSKGFKYKHQSIFAPTAESERLVDLLNPGSLNIIDTVIELDFLRKHVNDPIDTLLEQKERLTGVLKDLQTLKGLVRDPVQVEAIDNIINQLEPIETEADTKIQPKRDQKSQ